MTKDTVFAFRAPEGFSADPLTDFLRQGARQLIAQAVEVEALEGWMREELLSRPQFKVPLGGRPNSLIPRDLGKLRNELRSNGKNCPNNPNHKRNAGIAGQH